MKTELVDVTPTRRSLSVEIPSDIVDAEIARMTSKYGKSARLPGFRPGKVPPKIVRQRFRSQILHDVAHDLVQKAVGDAFTEQGVEPVNAPNIRDLVVEEGRPLTFTADFDILPAFDPGSFETIQARRSPVIVDDGAVEEALHRLREQAARYEPVEGVVAEDGHTLLVDIERQPLDKNGTPGQKNREEGISIEIGARSNPPGFNDEIRGMSAGAAKSFTVHYPEDGDDGELAGTDVAFTVLVHDIRRRVLPELDDEFAKDLGELETIEALRGQVRQDLETEARAAAERQTRAEVLKALADRVPFDVPASLVEREVDRRLEDFAQRLIAQRIDPRQVNIDWNAFRQGQQEPARESVRSALVLDEVAKREDIGVSEMELDAEVERFAQAASHTPAALRARLEQEGALERLAHTLRRDKALKVVMSRATIIEV